MFLNFLMVLGGITLTFFIVSIIIFIIYCNKNLG